MGAADRHLERWLQAGLLDEAQRERILDFEAATESRPAEAAGDRPSLVEALLYVGVAVAAAGVVALTGQDWQHLNGADRLAAFGVPGALGLIAGLLLRRGGEPPLGRAAGITWLVSVVLMGALVAVAGEELGWAGARTAVIASATAFSLAVGLWSVHRAQPQLLAVAGSVVFLAESITASWHPYHSLLAGLLILIAGAAGIALVESDRLTPRIQGARLAAALAMLGCMHIQLGDSAYWSVLPVLAAGAALIGLGMKRARVAYLGAGALVLFFGLVTFIFQHFEHTIGAPAALLLAGCLLVVAVLLAARWRRGQQAAAIIGA